MDTITQNSNFSSQETTTIDWDSDFAPLEAVDNRQLSTDKCGEWRFFYDPKTGRQKKYQFRCKNSDICSHCGEEEKRNVAQTLLGLSGNRMVVVDQEEEKQIARKYKADEYHRQPLEDGKTLFVIKTDEEIGEELTLNECSHLAQKIDLERGRRRSGKLGKPADDPEPKGELVEYREMAIEFNSDMPDAPKSPSHLEAMVQAEVEIDHSPESIDEVQYFLYLLEQKTREVCERYGMSFNFLLPKKIYIKIDEVYWDWLGKSSVVEEMESSLHSLLAKLR